MREHLIDFIKSFQEAAGEHRQQLTIGTTTPVTLTFGNGYYGADKVLVHRYEHNARVNKKRLSAQEVMDLEPAVDEFLKAFEPEPKQE